MTAFFAWLSDLWGGKRLMLVGSLLLIFSVYGLFSGLTLYGTVFVWFFILALASLAGMLNGCYAVAIAELFPAPLRYTGMGFSFSLGSALFGGLGPLIFTYLIQVCADSRAPAYYLLLCALLTLTAVTRLRDRRHSTSK
jgi:MFS family permease